jgi:ribonucleotide monophosphatase NagD (HAD superfamily)
VCNSIIPQKEATFQGSTPSSNCMLSAAFGADAGPGSLISGQLVTRILCYVRPSDHYCPFPDGRGEPDAGAIIAALEDCTGVKLAVNCGKPNPVMLNTIMNVMGLDTSQCLKAGDRLYTEIKMGIEAKMDTAVVFTGGTTPQMLAETAPENMPTYALTRIDQLIPAKLWAEFGWTDSGEFANRKTP